MLIAGQPFSRALIDNAAPPLVTAMAELGEATGNLPLALESALGWLQQRQRLRDNALRNLFYPLLVLVVALGIALAALLVLVPQIAALIPNTAEVTGMAAWVLNISAAVNAQPWWWAVVGVGMLAAVWAVRVSWRYGLLARVWHSAQFLTALAAATAASLSLDAALRVAAAVLPKRTLAHQQVQQTVAALAAGEAVSAALQRLDFLTPSARAWLPLIDQTGSPAMVLQPAAAQAQQQLGDKLAWLMTLAPPLAVLLAGGVVATVLLSLWPLLYQLPTLGVS